MSEKQSRLGLPSDLSAEDVKAIFDRPDDDDREHQQAAGECPYPVVSGLGMCCGNTSDCDMRFWRPCDATGGCLDRATCGGCGVPDLRRGERRNPLWAFDCPACRCYSSAKITDEPLIRCISCKRIYKARSGADRRDGANSTADEHFQEAATDPRPMRGTPTP